MPHTNRDSRKLKKQKLYCKGVSSNPEMVIKYVNYGFHTPCVAIPMEAYTKITWRNRPCPFAVNSLIRSARIQWTKSTTQWAKRNEQLYTSKSNLPTIILTFSLISSATPNMLGCKHNDIHLPPPPTGCRRQAVFADAHTLNNYARRNSPYPFAVYSLILSQERLHQQTIR